jgi:hypothetical protein
MEQATRMAFRQAIARRCVVQPSSWCISRLASSSRSCSRSRRYGSVARNMRALSDWTLDCGGGEARHGFFSRYPAAVVGERAIGFEHIPVLAAVATSPRSTSTSDPIAWFRPPLPGVSTPSARRRR